MPLYAFVRYDQIPCPHCGAILPNASQGHPLYITFQWGYCPSRWPSEVIYRVGDSVYWRTCRDGVVRGWTTFDGGKAFNVGDPAINALIVTDVGSDVAHFPTSCPACGKPIGGAALHIERNRIISAWAFAPGRLIEGAPPGSPGVRDYGELVEFSPEEAENWWGADYYVPGDDGKWTAMRDWEYKGSDYNDC